MDGVFCPQMTVGPPIVKALPDRFVKDVHLMIDEPLDKVARLRRRRRAASSPSTSSRRATRTACCRALAGTRRRPRRRAQPGTPVAVVEPLLDELELVLVLAVNPGWGGQSFIPATERRARARRAS